MVVWPYKHSFIHSKNSLSDVNSRRVLNVMSSERETQKCDKVRGESECKNSWRGKKNALVDNKSSCVAFFVPLQRNTTKKYYFSIRYFCHARRTHDVVEISGWISKK